MHVRVVRSRTQAGAVQSAASKFMSLSSTTGCAHKVGFDSTAIVRERDVDVELAVLPLNGTLMLTHLATCGVKLVF
jgi:hypothetical protein